MARRTYRGVPTNGVNDVQIITFGGTITGATFRLRCRGQNTAPITWSSTNNTLRDRIDSALEALGGVGAGQVTTTVGTMTSGIGTILVEFTGTLAKLAMPLIAVSDNSLTESDPEDPGTITVTRSVLGVSATLRSAATGDWLENVLNGGFYVNVGASPIAQWVPAEPALFADVQLTNTQVKALRATPQTLVTAPGAGLAIIVDRVYLVCSAAAGAYTESADNLVVEYSGGTDIVAIETTGFLDQAAVSSRTIRPDHTTALVTPVANQAVQLFNTGDGEFGGGNAANTFSIRTYYHTVPTVAFS